MQFYCNYVLTSYDEVDDICNHLSEQLVIIIEKLACRNSFVDKNILHRTHLESNNLPYVYDRLQ